ncbi:MAG: hypothetical protein U9R00_01460 [Patescibacteria group bacterium]|nr:hypothetical protein [Patescibacteria group bacterium]
MKKITVLITLFIIFLLITSCQKPEVVIQEKNKIIDSLNTELSLVKKYSKELNRMYEINNFEVELLRAYEAQKSSGRGIKLIEGLPHDIWISGGRAWWKTHPTDSTWSFAKWIDCDVYPNLFNWTKNYQYHLMDVICMRYDDIELVHTRYGSGYKDKYELVLLLTIPVIQGSKVYPAGSIYTFVGDSSYLKKYEEGFWTGHNYRKKYWDRFYMENNH